MPTRAKAKPAAKRTGRKPGQSSRAIAAAARTNGAGGGRPRSKLPPDIAAKLGDAPIGNPLKLARWFTDAIALLTQLCLEGQPYREMLKFVREAATASSRSLPHDIIFEAYKKIAADEKDMNAPSTGVRPTSRADDPIAQRAKPARREVS